ncbi:uncharacterized protein LOC143188399 [Calliopsis andreniformis]|uniref:uncharacterized protein LOC143188399 n=1 Tax=Calliopsis andreniformis TaxID=337506 RepID=UPI003FCCFA9E
MELYFLRYNATFQRKFRQTLLGHTQFPIVRSKNRQRRNCANTDEILERLDNTSVKRAVIHIRRYVLSIYSSELRHTPNFFYSTFVMQINAIALVLFLRPQTETRPREAFGKCVNHPALGSILAPWFLLSPPAFPYLTPYALSPLSSIRCFYILLPFLMLPFATLVAKHLRRGFRLLVFHGVQYPQGEESFIEGCKAGTFEKFEYRILAFPLFFSSQEQIKHPHGTYLILSLDTTCLLKGDK